MIHYSLQKRGFLFPLFHFLAFISPCVHAQLISHIQLVVTLRTVAPRAPLSLRLSRQEYWSGLPSPAPGDLPGPGLEPEPPASPALAGDSFTLSHLGNPYVPSLSFELLNVLFACYVSPQNSYVAVLNPSIPERDSFGN